MVIVRKQMTRAVNNRNRASVVHRQWMRRGARKQFSEIHQKRRVGAGMAVDHLVVVADAKHVELGGAEETNHKHMGRGEVLELVDEEVAKPCLCLAAKLTIGQETLNCPVNLLIKVDQLTFFQLTTEQTKRVGQSGHIVAFLFSVVRINEAHADTREAFEIGADRIGVAAAFRRGHESFNNAPHVALFGHRRTTEQFPTKRVEREDPGAECARAASQFLLGLFVVRDGHDGLGLDALLTEEIPQAFSKYTCLSGTRRGNDPRRSGVVRNRRHLVRSESDLRCRRARLRRHGQSLQIDRLAVNGTCT